MTISVFRTIDSCSFRGMKEDLKFLSISIKDLLTNSKGYRVYGNRQLRTPIFWTMYIVTLIMLVLMLLCVGVFHAVTCAFMIVRYILCLFVVSPFILVFAGLQFILTKANVSSKLMNLMCKKAK